MPTVGGKSGELRSDSRTLRGDDGEDDQAQNGERSRPMPIAPHARTAHVPSSGSRTEVERITDPAAGRKVVVDGGAVSDLDPFSASPSTKTPKNEPQSLHGSRAVHIIRS